MLLSFSESDESDELDELSDCRSLCGSSSLVSSLSEKAYLVFQPIRSSSRLFADQKPLRAFGLRSFGLEADVAASSGEWEIMFLDFAIVLLASTADEVA